MKELCQLVQRYIDGSIDIAEFRRAFVMGYLTVRSADSKTWNLAIAVESACDDFLQGILSEPALKKTLSAKVSEQATGFRFGSSAQPDLVSETYSTVQETESAAAFGIRFASVPA